MPRRLLMSDAVLRCKRRADKENDDHIGTSEWKALISEQYGDLYSVVAGTGLRYFETTSTITTTGVASYDEPCALLALVGVDRIVDSSGTRRTLAEIMAGERAYFSGLAGDATAYALVDDQLVLYPTPPSGQTYEMLYIPQPPDLSDAADDACLDVVTPDGEAFLIWGVAAKALAKAEQSVDFAVSEREQARVRLTEWATLRAFNNPRRRVIADDPFDGSFLDPADWRFR